MDFLPAAFDALRSYNQFILYEISSAGNNSNKKIKRPVCYKTLQVASALDPENWTNADDALALAQIMGPTYGVGFVFTKNDPFFFIDIDNCYSAQTGWSQESQDILKLFGGGAVEISTSMTGVHIIATGTPPANHACRANGVEFYSHSRFVALTGINAIGNASTDFSHTLPEFINTYFNNNTQAPLLPSQWWSDKPVSGWAGPESDETLIQRALQSQGFKSIIGSGARFSDLWDANENVLSVIYPPNDSDIYNRSEADAALAAHLTFWTGNNAERMQRLMMQSKLMREKYEREDYLPRTIRVACANAKAWLCDKPIEKKTHSQKSHVIQGSTFLNIEQQLEFFKDCTYVCDDNAVLVPGGHLLDQDRFNVMYGGYAMPIDAQNAKIARNAWHAFTMSQCIKHRRVQSTCFKPQHEFGEILEINGKLCVNTYWPYEPQKLEGNVEPFTNHLTKLFPNERDRLIMLSYLAALVQYKGVKFSWCPVIQGVEGNGKSLIAECLSKCVGITYSQTPKSDQITDKFNDWLYGTVLASVEDLYMPAHGKGTFDLLKPLITNTRAMIEKKYGKKGTQEICCNFIISTNHKDGVKKTKNDRRFAVFFTPHQTEEDIFNDGLSWNYFQNFLAWMNSETGMSNLNYFLSNFAIPDEFNPALGTRAPKTTSTMEAISESVGSLEQEILEAVDEEIRGFRGGWISSKALDNLINQYKGTWKVPPNRKRALVQSLGYDWHPYLPEGRSHAVIAAEGGKPRLYIKKGHSAASIQDKELIVKAYTEAQL